MPSGSYQQAQTPGASAAEPDASQSKCLERYYGVLPIARGLRNGFAGEIVDAERYASVCCIARNSIFPLSEAREHYSKGEGKWRSFPRTGKAVSREAIRAAAAIESAYAGAGLLAGFTLLSTLGIAYRSWTGDYWIDVEREVDPRSEEAATRATALGAIAGTAAGFGFCSLPRAQSKLASELKGVRPQMLPLKRLPFSLGIGCMVAAFFNSAGHVLYNTRR